MKRTLREFINDEYTGKKPHPTTIARRLRQGRIEGYKLVDEGQLYVVPTGIPETDDERANEILRRRYGSAA